MKNTLLVMLLGLSSTAFAIPTGMIKPAAGEETVTIRVHLQTGEVQMSEGQTAEPNWIKPEALAATDADARIQTVQYYGYGYGYNYATPCNNTIYAAPCEVPVNPCASACDSVPYYQVPAAPYVYTAPRPYYAPVQPYYVPPRRVYRANPYIYYDYPRYPHPRPYRRW